MRTSDPTWPQLITLLVQAKSTLNAVDLGLWPYYYPELAATQQEVERAESALGMAVPSFYRDFLLYANGWRGFFQTLDLLSTSQLIEGKHKHAFNQVVRSLDGEQWAAMGLNPIELIPLGVSLEDKDMLIGDVSANDNEPPVIWFAGEIVDRWPNFIECFKSMISYTEREIRHFSATV